MGAVRADYDIRSLDEAFVVGATRRRWRRLMPLEGGWIELTKSATGTLLGDALGRDP